MTAKKGTAPCGHPGTFVTAGFITCDLRCEFPSSGKDAVPDPIDPEITKPLCKHCGSGDVTPWDQAFNFSGKTLWHCKGCGNDGYQ